MNACTTRAEARQSRTPHLSVKLTRKNNKTSEQKDHEQEQQEEVAIEMRNLNSQSQCKTRYASGSILLLF